MFLQASVCSQGRGRVSLSHVPSGVMVGYLGQVRYLEGRLSEVRVSEGRVSHEGSRVSGGRVYPKYATPDTLPPELQKRAVCNLLECFLVYN